MITLKILSTLEHRSDKLSIIMSKLRRISQTLLISWIPEQGYFFGFIWGFYLYGDITITAKVCKFWLYSARTIIEKWGFFSVPTYCDTGHPFIMVISEEPWNSHLLLSFGSGSVTTYFYHLGPGTSAGSSFVLDNISKCSIDQG